MSTIFIQILVQIILILINAFFAMSEIAILSLNPTKLKNMAKDNKTAAQLVKMVEDPSGFLSTIQIGITLAGFLGSAFAADGFSKYLVDWIYYDLAFTVIPLDVLNVLSIMVITLILAYFTLVFGELVPKRIAMQKPMEVAYSACNILKVIGKITNPLVLLLTGSTNLVLKLLRLDTKAQEESVSEEDILMMAELGTEKGVIEPYENEWIENVFDFTDSSIREVMVRNKDLIAIDINMKIEDVYNIVINNNHSRFPVYSGNITNIVGVLKARDFLIGCVNKGSELKKVVEECYYIPDVTKAAKLFKMMQKDHKAMAIVVNEYGETTGIVTIEDLVEEIVGDLTDEETKPLVVALENGQYEVDGECLIDDLADYIGVKIEHDSAILTVSGLIISHIDAVPNNNERFDVELNGIIYHVMDVTNHQIKNLIVEIVEENMKE